MAISQCPRCELKFSNASEMRWHLREDHPSGRPVQSTPLTVSVQRPHDPAGHAATATTSDGHRMSRWWRLWKRGHRR